MHKHPSSTLICYMFIKIFKSLLFNTQPTRGPLSGKVACRIWYYSPPPRETKITRLVQHIFIFLMFGTQMHLPGQEKIAVFCLNLVRAHIRDLTTLICFTMTWTRTSYTHVKLRNIRLKVNYARHRGKSFVLGSCRIYGRFPRDPQIIITLVLFFVIFRSVCRLVVVPL